MPGFLKDWQHDFLSSPLISVYKELLQNINSSCYPCDCSNLFSGPISIPKFAYYVLFEAVAERIREKLRDEPQSLHAYISLLDENDDLIKGYEDPYDQISTDLQLRKEFLLSELARFDLERNTEKITWVDKMENRSNLRNGYGFTLLQLKQLHDKNKLSIQKKNRFRQFSSDSHVKKTVVQERIIQYYTSLKSYAEECKAELDVKLRVINAINLNDFESRNICMFLYHTAQYCADNNISEIDEDTIKRLIKITGVAKSENGCLICHKPVVYMMNYIKPAMAGDDQEIDRYMDIESRGLYYRRIFLPPLLERIEFSYEDVWNFFFCSPQPFATNLILSYNIFDIFPAELNWDNKENVIPILRRLIKEITIDPLSKTFEK